MFRMRFSAFLCALALLIPGSSAGGAHPASGGIAEPLAVQKSLVDLVELMQADLLARTTRALATGDPAQSHRFFIALYEASQTKVFCTTMRTIARYPELLRRFLDAALDSMDQKTFSNLVIALSDDPESIRTITLNSLLRLPDEDIIQTLRTTVKHPQALKLFTEQLDPRVLAEFNRNTLSDREAVAVIVEIIQKDRAKLRDLAPGVDLYEITGSIVKALDANYFKDLLITDDNPEMQFLGLSLADGIIDLPGQEKIDLAGVNRQALKMADSAGFLFSFVWNIYFGDQSSQTALRYRKSLQDAAGADGTKDEVVDLRALAKADPAQFAQLYQTLADLLSITRFRERLSDPEILLDPLLEFIDRYPARQVADTLSPLFIRSVDLRPELAKIVVMELPAEVIGTLLGHVVDQLASTQSGRETLKRLMLSVWKTLPTPELKKAVLAINQRDPVALYEMVVPVVRSLSPKALGAVTIEFLRYDEVFYRYNGAGLRGLPPQVMGPISEAVVKKPEEFYRLSLDIFHAIPPAEQNAVLRRLSADPTLFPTIDTMVVAVPKPLRKEVSARFSAQPARSRAIARGIPKRLSDQVIASFQKP